MEVTVPKGYEAQKMVVTYTKKDIVEHTDQYIYESPDGGQTVYQKKLGEAKRELVKEPKTQVCIKVPVDKDGKIIVPIDPRRKVGGQCEMCWKKSATNHDLCHRCQAKLRHRFATAFGLPSHS